MKRARGGMGSARQAPPTHHMRGAMKSRLPSASCYGAILRERAFVREPAGALN